jgi:hypothetical protein
MSNSNSKQSSFPFTKEGFLPKGEIKDGPSLFCVKQYKDKKLPFEYCFFSDCRSHQLRAEVIDVVEKTGGSANLTVNFIFNGDGDAVIKIPGSIDYHPELIGTGRMIGVYQISPT